MVKRVRRGGSSAGAAVGCVPIGEESMNALSLRLMTGALFFAIASSALAPSVGVAAEMTAVAKPRALPTETKAWTGDFDGMVKRRQLRVLVPHSRSLYFNDKGRERGLTADLVRDFERHINQ
jgi:hypothetical protein